MIYAFRAEASSWLFPILTLLAIQSIPHDLRMSTKVLYNIDHIQIDAIAYILYFRTNWGLTDQNKVQYSMTDPLPWFSKLLTFWKELCVALRHQPLKLWTQLYHIPNSFMDDPASLFWWESFSKQSCIDFLLGWSTTCSGSVWVKLSQLKVGKWCYVTLVAVANLGSGCAM